MNVYKAISLVQAELAKEGISKDRTNSQQGYKFRGIDDVYAALAPVLAKNGLCFLPRVLSRACEERQTQKGGTLFYVVVEAEFDLVAAEDGSSHTVRTFGEAMDSADKATNKAMSAAYKYAAFQAFCIPCEGEDADATTHEVAPRSAPRPETPHSPSAIQIHECPVCSGPVQKVPGATKENKWPKWKCQAKDCTGGKGGKPWASWHDNPFEAKQNAPESTAQAASSAQGTPDGDALLGLVARAEEAGINATDLGKYTTSVMRLALAEVTGGALVALNKKLAAGEISRWLEGG